MLSKTVAPFNHKEAFILTVLAVIITTVVIWRFRKAYQRSQCRKLGHIWTGRKKLKCKRCGRRHHQHNILKPM